MADSLQPLGGSERDWTPYILGSAALLVIFGLLAFFMAGPTIARQSGIGQVMRVAAAQLRDPSSAQFRNVARHGIFVCGEINGKNGYGAYDGFVRFYGDKDSVTIDPQDSAILLEGLPSRSASFDQSFNAYCS
jgi:hypothetical protein